MSVELRQVWFKGLKGASLQLPTTGMHVILGSPLAGAEDIAGLLSGANRPHRGQVLVLGAEPHRSPQTRQALACLLPQETWGCQGTVAQALQRALTAMASQLPPQQLLSQVGLESWAQRPCAHLEAPQQRTLAALLALHSLRAEARVAVWHEPFANTPGLARGLIRTQLQQSSHHALIVAVTASIHTALELGGQLQLLEAGQFVSSTSAILGSFARAPGAWRTLRIHSPQARLLAALAVADPRITGVSLSATNPGLLRLQSATIEELAQAVTELVAHRAEIHVEQLQLEAGAL